MNAPQPSTQYAAHALGRHIVRERPLAEIERSRCDVRVIVTEESEDIRDPLFLRICTEDVAMMFRVYDCVFFDGQVANVLADRRLTFRLARRATSRGGSLHRFRPQTPAAGAPPEWFEMTVSTSLLFASFGADARPVSIGGHVCVDRLDALQRIMEHEIIHLVEHLCWGASSCAGARFRSLVRAIFGHTVANHALVTPRERAAEQGVVRGGQVAFVFGGTRYEGIVSRVTRRVTVLVPDPSGEPMSDGRRYLRFYVPIAQLTPV